MATVTYLILHGYIYIYLHTAPPPSDEATITRTVSDCATSDAESGIIMSVKDMENLICIANRA